MAAYIELLIISDYHLTLARSIRISLETKSLRQRQHSSWLVRHKHCLCDTRHNKKDISTLQNFCCRVCEDRQINKIMHQSAECQVKIRCLEYEMSWSTQLRFIQLLIRLSYSNGQHSSAKDYSARSLAVSQNECRAIVKREISIFNNDVDIPLLLLLLLERVKLLFGHSNQNKSIVHNEIQRYAQSCNAWITVNLEYRKSNTMQDRFFFACFDTVTEILFRWYQTKSTEKGNVWFVYSNEECNRCVYPGHYSTGYCEHRERQHRNLLVETIVASLVRAVHES